MVAEDKGMRRGFLQVGAWLLAAAMPCLPGPASQPAPAAKPAPFPRTRAFLDEGPPNLRLIGSTVRLRNGIPFYTLAYYVNLAELRAAIGATVPTMAEAARVLIGGKVSQGFMTRFEQGVGRERRVEFLLENLELYWPGPGFRRDSATLQGFLPFFDRALERAEETRIWIRNGSIYTQGPGQKAARTADADLCHAFVNSYLGDLKKPGADRIMREDLLKNLADILAEPRPGGRPAAR